MKKYDILVVDPPWPKKKGGLRESRPNQGKELDYKTMSVYEIFQLLHNAIFPACNQIHTVFMWSIDEFLVEAEHSMEAYGYKRHARMIWDKTNGVAPAFSIRYTHEYVTWWYKPKFTQVADDQKGKYTTVFTEKAREHSRKPEVFYDMIEKMFPSHTKLDVFSRQKRKGWGSIRRSTGILQ